MRVIVRSMRTENNFYRSGSVRTWTVYKQVRTEGRIRAYLDSGLRQVPQAMCWYGDAVENVIGGILPNRGLKYSMTHTGNFLLIIMTHNL